MFCDVLMTGAKISLARLDIKCLFCPPRYQIHSHTQHIEFTAQHRSHSNAHTTYMGGWLRLVGSIKLHISFAEYRLFYRALLQKRPIILSILLTEATPYQIQDHTQHKSTLQTNIITAALVQNLFNCRHLLFFYFFDHVSPARQFPLFFLI